MPPAPRRPPSSATTFSPALTTSEPAMVSKRSREWATAFSRSCSPTICMSSSRRRAASATLRTSFGSAEFPSPVHGRGLGHEQAPSSALYALDVPVHDRNVGVLHVLALRNLHGAG